MSGVTGGRRDKRTTARIEAPTQSRKRSATATPRTYGTAPALDPSGGAGREVGDADGEAGPVGESLELQLPQSCSIAVAAAGIRGDEQLVRIAVTATRQWDVAVETKPLIDGRRRALP